MSLSRTDPIPPLEVLDIGVAVLPASVTAVERTATFFQLTWVIEGRAVAHLNGEDIDLPWGGVLLAKPGDRVWYTYFAEGPRARFYQGFLHFSAPVTPSTAAWPRTRQLAEGDFLIALFEHLLWLDSERPENWRSLAGEALRYGLGIYASGNTGRVVGDGRKFSEIVVRALNTITPAWMDGSPLPSPTLNELAQAAGVSREYLCRVFAREVGLAPATTLRLLRICRAASLLTATNMPIAEVGRATGFSSEFHFSHAFRNHLGVSPSQYRASGPGWVGLPSVIHQLNGLLSAHSVQA